MITNYILNEQGKKDVDYFKNNMAKTMVLFTDLLPPGRETSLFWTKIEEAVFFGTKAISSNPENFSEIISYPLNNT